MLDGTSSKPDPPSNVHFGPLPPPSVANLALPHLLRPPQKDLRTRFSISFFGVGLCFRLLGVCRENYSTCGLMQGIICLDSPRAWAASGLEVVGSDRLSCGGDVNKRAFIQKSPRSTSGRPHRSKLPRSKTLLPVGLPEVASARRRGRAYTDVMLSDTLRLL